jgi:cysteine sulfinate desulfinase/cysteine desulfurase-like protein
MGLAEERVRSAVRFSLGRGNTEEEIVRVVDVLVGIVGRMRKG